MATLGSGKVKNLLRKIVNKGFLPHNLLLLRHKLLESLGREPVLIYTMGKVGSTTVFHAFQQQYMFPLTYHVHHLTSESLMGSVNRYKKKDLKILGKTSLRALQKGNSSHMSASHILRDVYSETSQRQWNIVTLVRDPFSTYLSHLFQNPQIIRPFLLDEDDTLDEHKVVSHINDTFSNFNPEKNYISNWFDSEFFAFTGVDLYRYPFNAEKGYTLIQEGKFNIAVLALEKLDENLPEVIDEFVSDGKAPVIKRKNVRSETGEKNIYKDLKSKVAVPREGLERFYSTKFAQHFFTEEFRKRMINKWAED